MFAKLANTIVVILTTLFSSISSAPTDRRVDESSQWNAFDSHLEEKSVVDSKALTTSRFARLTHRKRNGSANDTSDLPSQKMWDERRHYDDTFDALPHTSFGAGSSALSSLGHNASIPQLRA